MKYLLIIIGSFLITACFKKPDITITDKYFKVVNPGDILGIVEIRPIDIDTVMGYPLKEESISSFEVIYRKTKKKVKGNVTFKIFFEKENKKYQWRVSKNPMLADYYDVDTIKLKPFTWYRVTTQNYKYNVYFYSNGKSGDFSVVLKPTGGAY